MGLKMRTGISLVREPVDSLCRDGTDTQYYAIPTSLTFIEMFLKLAYLLFQEVYVCCA